MQLMLQTLPPCLWGDPEDVLSAVRDALGMKTDPRLIPIRTDVLGPPGRRPRHRETTGPAPLARAGG